MMDLLMRYGHIPIAVLLLAILHGVKFRIEWEKNGDGKSRLKYRIYFANKSE
jgi:hypothetical protein